MLKILSQEVKDKEAIRHIRKFQTHITSLLKLIKKNDVPTSNEALAEEAELGKLLNLSDIHGLFCSECLIFNR